MYDLRPFGVYDIRNVTAEGPIYWPRQLPKAALKARELGDYQRFDWVDAFG
jgi:hypothetical protein